MNIVIDHSQCQEPETCGRCLQVCSPQVFVIHPQEEDAVIPGRWVVTPIWTGLCTGCIACVKECPHEAIVIK